MFFMLNFTVKYFSEIMPNTFSDIFTENENASTDRLAFFMKIYFLSNYFAASSVEAGACSTACCCASGVAGISV